MTAETWKRLFDPMQAIHDPMTLALTAGVAGALVLSGSLIFILHQLDRMTDEHRRELSARWKSWCGLVVVMLVPILLGAAPTVLAVLLLSLLCYREFARVTGLFREKTISVCVVAGVLLVMFAAFDHYDRLFFAAAPLTVAMIAMITIPHDRPEGYIQRVALGVLGFLLFGFSLGYLANIANAPNYRPILLLMLIAVELNDVFAYCSGKLIGGPKLLPRTSPGKTMAGAAGALVLTTALVAALGWWIFAGTPMQRIDRLIALGVLISGLGQLGDLMLSSIKRDVGIKDTGRLIPGHGGLLDRFDSLVLVPPAVFHYLSLCLGPLGGSEPVRILTGG